MINEENKHICLTTLYQGQFCQSREKGWDIVRTA